MHHTPKLTIVIPTLNRSRLLKRAVESALAQTATNIEIIVSNNGSTDDTRDILDKFEDPRMRVINRDMTIDACSHGNDLLAQARGDFFLGLSDDDYIEPSFSADLIAFFEAHPKIVFAYTGCNIHYADISVPAKTGPSVEPGIIFLSEFLAGKRDVCWCACVTRTNDLRSIGDIPRHTICGDMFYWTKLATKGDVGCVRRSLSHYVAYRNDGDNSSTGTPVYAWAKEIENLTNFIVQACMSNQMDPSNSRRIQRLGKSFLARSTADQFVWNALRGSSHLALLVALTCNLHYLARGPLSVWLRVAAAIFAPKDLLRSRVLATASKKALRIQEQALLHTTNQ